MTALLSAVRTFCIDAPLALFFLLYAVTLSLRHVHESYLSPLAAAMTMTNERFWYEVTYYHRFCDESDVSTADANDLVVGPELSTDGAVDAIMTHGLGIFPDILHPDTAAAMRNFVLEKNDRLDPVETVYVPESEHRWSFAPGANEHPAVSRALREIALHPAFRPVIDKLLGPNPAVIEFQTITAAFGADDQPWHQDVISTKAFASRARTYLPHYTLFVALQDTTADMGATQVIPGSHRCIQDDFANADELGIKVSGTSANITNNVWKARTGILMDQHTFHRGTAHVDPNAPHRVMMLLTFTEKPLPRAETRFISLGTVVALRWDMFGHTLNDIADAPTRMAQPWTTLRSLGLYNRHRRDDAEEWGWDFVTLAVARIVNGDYGFQRSDLMELLDGKWRINAGGWIPTALLGDRPNDDEDGEKGGGKEWLTFIDDTLNRCRFWFGAANAAALGLYFSLLGSYSIGAYVEQRRWTPGAARRRDALLAGAVRRLAFTHGAIAIAACGVLRYASTMPWARNLKSRRLFTPPLPHNEGGLPEEFGDDDYLAKVATPQKDDILIGTLYNPGHLAAINRFLDYHPGNVSWRRLISSSAQQFIKHKGLPPVFQDSIVASVFETLVKGEGRRFLLQNEFADWVVMTERRAKQITREKLLTEGDGLVQLLNNELVVFAACRFGEARGTVLCRRFVPGFVDEWQRRLFLEERSSGESFSTRGNCRKTMNQPNLFQRARAQYLRGGTQPRSKSVSVDAMEKKIKRDACVLYAENTDDKLKQSNTEEPSFDVGDPVEVFYAGNKWLPAKVYHKQIRGNDTLYHVEFQHSEKAIIEYVEIMRSPSSLPQLVGAEDSHFVENWSHCNSTKRSKPDAMATRSACPNSFVFKWTPRSKAVSEL